MPPKKKAKKPVQPPKIKNPCGKCKKPKALKGTPDSHRGAGAWFCGCGRKTKYKPEYCDKLVSFFKDTPPTKEWVAETVREFYKDGTEKKKLDKKKMIPNTLPTLLKFAESIGVDYTTVYRWAHKSAPDEDFESFQAEFCKAYKKALKYQKEFLIANGLNGASPSAAYIFTAKNLTDMRDKQEVENKHTIDVESVKKVEELSEEELQAELQKRLFQGE